MQKMSFRQVRDIQEAVWFTLVKSSRIYTGQYTFPILFLSDGNILGENKGRDKNIFYGSLF